MKKSEQDSINKITVRDDSTVKDALEAISGNRLMAVFVVDRSNHLAGVITYGDIRYAMLKGVNLNISVRSIMNPNPITVNSEKPPEELYKMMLHKAIMTIPRVDKEGKFVDYYNFFEISKHLPNSEFDITGNGPGSRLDDINRVLVIGGAGYIGSVLVDRLLNNGYGVKVLDALLYGEESLKIFRSSANFCLIRGDVRNTEVLLSALSNVDAVIHLGEIVGDPACALNDDFTVDVNFLATKNIVEICVLRGIRRMIFASSCSVYGVGGSVLLEESELNPVSLYAQCKIECEKVILSHETSEFSPTILRLGTVFGASYRPRFDLVVNLLTAKAIFDGKMTIYGGDQWRPFISVNDVTRAIIASLEAPVKSISGEIFNTGDERLNYRIVEVGEEIKKVYPSTEILFTDNVDDKRDYNVAFSKIRKVLDFKCKTSLIEGVHELADMINARDIVDYQDKYYHNLLTLSS